MKDAVARLYDAWRQMVSWLLCVKINICMNAVYRFVLDFFMLWSISVDEFFDGSA